jgi:hypothetical protein
LNFPNNEIEKSCGFLQKNSIVTLSVKHLCYGFPRECLKAFGNGTISYREGQMDWDDEFDNGDHGIGNSSQQHGIIDEKKVNGGFDPMDVASPISAHFFLSDDA